MTPSTTSHLPNNNNHPQFPTCPIQLLKALPNLKPSPHLTSHLINHIIPNLPELVQEKHIIVSILEHLPYLLGETEAGAVSLERWVLPGNHASMVSSAGSSASNGRVSSSTMMRSSILVKTLHHRKNVTINASNTTASPLKIIFSLLQHHLLRYENLIIPILSVMQQLAKNHQMRQKVLDYAIGALRYCPEEDLPSLSKTILRTCLELLPDSSLKRPGAKRRRLIHTNRNLTRAVQMMRQELQLVEDVNILAVIVNEVLLPVMQVNSVIFYQFRDLLLENGGSLTEFDVLLLMVLLSVSTFESQEILEVFDELMDRGELTPQLLIRALESYRETISPRAIEQLAIYVLQRDCQKANNTNQYDTLDQTIGSAPLQRKTTSPHLIPFFFFNFPQTRRNLISSLLASLSESPFFAHQIGQILVDMASNQPEVLAEYCNQIEEALYQSHRYTTCDVVHCLCATLARLVHVKREQLTRSLLIYVRKQMFSSSEKGQSFALICLSHLIHEECVWNYSDDILQLLERAVSINTSQYVETFGQMPPDMLCRHFFLMDLINYNWSSRFLCKNRSGPLLDCSSNGAPQEHSIKEHLFVHYLKPLSEKLVFWKPSETVSLEKTQFTFTTPSDPSSFFFDTKHHFSSNILQWEHVLNTMAACLQSSFLYADTGLFSGQTSSAMLRFSIVFPFDWTRLKVNQKPSFATLGTCQDQDTQNLVLFCLLCAYVTVAVLSKYHFTQNDQQGINDEESLIQKHVLLALRLKYLILELGGASQHYNALFNQHSFNGAMLADALHWCHEHKSDFEHYCTESMCISPQEMEQLLLTRLYHVDDDTVKQHTQVHSNISQALQFSCASACMARDNWMEDMIRHPSSNFLVQDLMNTCTEKSQLLSASHPPDTTSNAQITRKKIMMTALLTLNIMAPHIRNGSLCKMGLFDTDEEKRIFIGQWCDLFFQEKDFFLAFMMFFFVHQISRETCFRAASSTLGISLLQRQRFDGSANNDEENPHAELLQFYIQSITESEFLFRITHPLDDTCDTLWAQIRLAVEFDRSKHTLLQLTILIVLFCTNDDDVTYFIEDMLLSVKASSKSKPFWYKQLGPDSATDPVWDAFFVPLFYTLQRVVESMPLNLEDSAPRYCQILDLLLLSLQLYLQRWKKYEGRRKLADAPFLFQGIEHLTRLLEENCDMILSKSDESDRKEHLFEVVSKTAQFSLKLQEYVLNIRQFLKQATLTSFQRKTRKLDQYIQDMVALLKMKRIRAKSHLTPRGKSILRAHFGEKITQLTHELQELTGERESHLENEYFVLKKAWRELPDESPFVKDQNIATSDAVPASEAIIEEQVQELLPDNRSMSSDDQSFAPSRMDDGTTIGDAVTLVEEAQEDSVLSGGRSFAFGDDFDVSSRRGRKRKRSGGSILDDMMD